MRSWMLIMTLLCGTIQGKQLYSKTGAIDVFTFENTIFYWHNTMYVLENIPCAYWDHAGIWFPQYKDHSYARIRNLDTGHVLHNISSTITFGFISAFTDYEHDTVWLFGTQADRCGGPSNRTYVQSWHSKDLFTWETKLALPFPKSTYNVQVTKVGPLGGAPIDSKWTQPSPKLPPHKYAMFLEAFYWAVNNNEKGDLTTGWQLIESKPPKVPSGGPSMRYNPVDGYYYILTGGHHVYLLRTKEFQTWEESNPSPFLEPTPGDAAVSPYCNFSSAAHIKGTPVWAEIGKVPNRPFVPYWVGNWTSWDWNSNDADICCMHVDMEDTYIVYGSRTQGGSPHPPLDGSSASTNSVAVVKGKPLYHVLPMYF